MKYSQIIGPIFYKIELSTKMQDVVDAHFAGASHHLYRFREAKKSFSHYSEFHLIRHKAHLRKLMGVVYKHGDFSRSEDRSMLDLDLRESWNPDKRCIPDHNMFNSMIPDARYLEGEEHPFDSLLDNMDLSSIRASHYGIPRLRLVGNG